MNLSLAEYIRRAVRRELGTEHPATDVSAIFSFGNSGGSDIAANKAAYIGEAVEAAHLRKRGQAPT